MKKLIGMMLAIGLVAGGAYANEGKEGDKAGKEVSAQAKADAYEKYAKDYEARADKALEAGKADLAAVYKKCAAAKRKMSQGYANADKELLAEANKEYSAARKELDTLTPKKECDKTKDKTEPKTEQKSEKCE